MKILAISDTHGHTNWPLEECDLILHAGDVVQDMPPKKRNYQGYSAWLEAHYYPWVLKYAPRVVMTWGNHDFTQEFSSRLAAEAPAGVHILVDELLEVDGLKIWGSPWSNQYGNWAWMRDPMSLVYYYDSMPDNLDIYLSHQPPSGPAGVTTSPYTGQRESLGSTAFEHNILYRKPKAVVCGHIHGGHGIYDYGDTKVYNVAVLDELYGLRWGATEVTLNAS